MRHLAICLPILLLSACNTAQRPVVQNDHPTLRVADAALASGSPEIAVNVARGVLARDAYNVPAQLMLAHAFYTLKLYPESEAAFKVVLKLRPNDAAANLGLGRIKLSQQDFPAAEAYFRRAAQQEVLPETLSNLGVALDLQHRHAEAQAEYQRALAIDPASAATQANLALSLTRASEAGLTADAAPINAAVAPPPRAVNIRPLPPATSAIANLDVPDASE